MSASYLIISSSYVPGKERGKKRKREGASPATCEACKTFMRGEEKEIRKFLCKKRKERNAIV